MIHCAMVLGTLSQEARKAVIDTLRRFAIRLFNAEPSLLYTSIGVLPHAHTQVIKIALKLERFHLGNFDGAVSKLPSTDSASTSLSTPRQAALALQHYLEFLADSSVALATPKPFAALQQPAMPPRRVLWILLHSLESPLSFRDSLEPFMQAGWKVRIVCIGTQDDLRDMVSLVSSLRGEGKGQQGDDACLLYQCQDLMDGYDALLAAWMSDVEDKGTTKAVSGLLRLGRDATAASLNLAIHPLFFDPLCVPTSLLSPPSAPQPPLLQVMERVPISSLSQSSLLGGPPTRIELGGNSSCDSLVSILRARNEALIIWSTHFLGLMKEGKGVISPWLLYYVLLPIEGIEGNGGGGGGGETAMSPLQCLTPPPPPLAPPHASSPHSFRPSSLLAIRVASCDQIVVPNQLAPPRIHPIPPPPPLSPNDAQLAAHLDHILPTRFFDQRRLRNSTNDMMRHYMQIESHMQQQSAQEQSRVRVNPDASRPNPAGM